MSVELQPDQPLAQTVATPVLNQPRLSPGAGVRISIRGRSMRLRGLMARPRGPMLWLALLGPGMIAGAAGNDAGGIATYSQAGAQFGYDLLWVLSFSTICLAVVQDMCARLGTASGRGLLDLIRERYGVGWVLFAQGSVFIANGTLIVSEFLAVGAAAELLGVGRFVAVPLAAILVWVLVVAGSYGRVEKLFLLMALAFLAYPVAALFAHPNWGQVGRALIVPAWHSDGAFLLMFVAMLGATMTPYQQLFQQSAVVEKRVTRQDYAQERADTFVGMSFSNIIGAFIMVATAVTLHASGKTQIGSAAEAAAALAPVAGNAAAALFGIGLLGAGLLAAAVLPLTTAYSISEAFGFRKGVNLDFRRARTFMTTFTLLVVVGAGLALLPGLPVIQFLVAIQVLNGILLPLFVLFILRLANDPTVAKELRNGRLSNVLGGATLVVTSVAALALIGSQVGSWLGL